MGHSPALTGVLEAATTLNDATLGHEHQEDRVLNPANWNLDRFQGEPPPLEYLVGNLIPLGVAGALYSPGGTGKSTIALELAIRTAIAEKYPTLWLGAYPISRGGAVAYVSAEEPDGELHRRLHGLIEVVAGDVGVTVAEVFEEVKKFLYVANFQGSGLTFFDVSANSISISTAFQRTTEALKAIQSKSPIRLIVLDTRSRLSGAEGAGNAIVSREIGYLETWVREFKANLLILHHTNKASLSGQWNAMQSIRGESAFLDTLRFGIQLQAITEDLADAKGIPREERKNYLVLTNSKQNYTEKQDPIVIQRDGFRFEKADFEPNESKSVKQAMREEQDRQSMLEVVRANPDLPEVQLINHTSLMISVKRKREALAGLIEAGLVSFKKGPRKAKLHFVSVESEEGEPNAPI
jgi:RecA-family ATPase